MKFAHEFKDTLEREGFPDHWRAAAIPYSQLKKCLKKVQKELETLGLDKETLQHLLAAQTVSPKGESIPVARYKLDEATAEHTLRPRLSVFVHLQGGQVVDAALSPASRAFLQRLSGRQSPNGTSPSLSATQPDDASALSEDSIHIGGGGDEMERIEIPLVFDGEFFNILQTDVDSLDMLQEQEEKAMESDIKTLSEEVSAVAKPSKKFAKSDLNRWREIFDLYLDAQVFFSSHEQDHGARSSAKAVQQLIWFQNEIANRELLSKFKVPSSRAAYARFLQLNATLLQNLKFQEINKTAITKILKKFDKRTSLGASFHFRSAVRAQRFLAGNVAKKLCAQLSQEVVSVVPRVEDYSCPICFSIAWYPVRLKCSHFFCVRCIIKMQREKKKECPLCRMDVVMDADQESIDKDLEKYMRLYFRKETDEKQKANEIERGMEVFGEQYKHSSCVVM